MILELASYISPCALSYTCSLFPHCPGWVGVQGATWRLHDQSQGKAEFQVSGNSIMLSVAVCARVHARVRVHVRPGECTRVFVNVCT